MKELLKEIPIPSGRESASIFALRHPYIGRDGRDYYSPEALQAANEQWKRLNLPFIGADGKYYGTRGTLKAANSLYRQSRFPRKLT